MEQNKLFHIPFAFHFFMSLDCILFISVSRLHQDHFPVYK